MRRTCPVIKMLGCLKPWQHAMYLWRGCMPVYFRQAQCSGISSFGRGDFQSPGTRVNSDDSHPLRTPRVSIIRFPGSTRALETNDEPFIFKAHPRQEAEYYDMPFPTALTAPKEQKHKAGFPKRSRARTTLSSLWPERPGRTRAPERPRRAPPAPQPGAPRGSPHFPRPGGTHPAGAALSSLATRSCSGGVDDSGS